MALRLWTWKNCFTVYGHCYIGWSLPSMTNEPQTRNWYFRDPLPIQESSVDFPCHPSWCCGSARAHYYYCYVCGWFGVLCFECVCSTYYIYISNILCLSLTCAITSFVEFFVCTGVLLCCFFDNDSKRIRVHTTRPIRHMPMGSKRPNEPSLYRHEVWIPSSYETRNLPRNTMVRNVFMTNNNTHHPNNNNNIY